MNAIDATNMLWSVYHPYKLWYQFAIIGLISAVGMLLYSLWVKRSKSMNG